MFTSRGIVFIGLNAVRLLSLLTLILVFASNILVIVHDIQAVNKFMAVGSSATITATSTDGTNTTSHMECDYIPGSTVPNQAAGVFWAVLNRLLILAECLFLMLSEVGFPMKFFDVYFPVLGSNFGVGALGIFQCLIGAAVLSHHIDEFALVAAFFLFSVGCINMLVGLIWRSSSKSKRALKAPTPDLPTSIKNLSLGTKVSFPDGFTNVTHSTYSTSSVEKPAAPAYGYQANNAFGRAGEKAGIFLNRQISISQPEQAHPNATPRVTFPTRNSPTFGSSPDAV